MHSCFKLLGAFILILHSHSTTMLAQQENQRQPSVSAVPNDLAALRAELKNSTELDAATQSAIALDLAEAEEEIARAAELSKLANAYSELPDPAEQRKVFEQQIAAIKQAELVSTALPASNEALTTEIKAARDRVELLRKQTQDAGSEANRRAGRREIIRPRLLETEAKIKEIDKQLAQLPTPLVALDDRAKRFRRLAQKAKLELDSSTMKNELGRFDAEESEGIVRLQLELFRNQLARETGLLSKLELVRREREEKAAAEAATEAKKQQAAMESRNPLLADSYEINTQLAELNETFVKRSATISTELKEVKDRLDTIQRQFAETEVMVEQVGLSGSVGNLLRQRKSDLPHAQLNANKAREIKHDVESIQFQLFDINRRQSELTRATIESEILNNENATNAGLDALDTQVDSLLAARREILVALKRNVRNLFDALVVMEFSYRTLANVSKSYRQFLNERIFWIKSNELLFSEWDIDESDEQIFEPEAWQSTGSQFVQLVKANPLGFGLLLFGTLGLVALRPRLRSEIRSMGQIASRGSCASFWPTLRSLFATLLLSVVTPLPLLVIGFAIQWSPLNDGRSLFYAIGGGLIAAGLFALPVELLRHVCRDNGLAQKHFSWSNEAVAVLKRNLGWFSPFGTVIVFCLVLLQRLDSTHRVDMIERILFVIGMFCLFVFLRRVMSPSQGIFKESLRENKNSWLYKTSTLWFIFITGIPVLLAGLAVWGYYYTTLSLILCAFSTFVFGVILETLRALLKRFVLVRRRRAHIESAKRKRELEREQREQERIAGQPSDGEEFPTPVLPEAFLNEMDPVVDIDENAVEATRLIGLGTLIIWIFGLWIIWADVLPALKALDKQPIFPGRLLADRSGPGGSADASTASGEASVEAAAVSTPPSDDATTKTNPTTADSRASNVSEISQDPADGSLEQNEITAITYGDVLLFLFITAITIAAARSLPGTLEMIFLNQLPLDRSVRFATKSLFSYAIVMLGMVLAFGALSIKWSNVQWLATALTFGLAFGLQEIFANFVAGIILMFERPMRIGDWITIDDFTGMVTRIRTRATTIVNFDRKEYIIPNKDFITGRLVNWTLSDAINRVEVKVGIAYGSDVNKAKEILYGVSNDHPKIVSDPPASVAFQEFGDSSLNLILRAYLQDIESRVPTIDELHMRINQRFAEAGIEISFPQRDLHIRSVDPSLGGMLDGRAN